MNNISDGAIQAVTAQETDKVFLHLLTIETGIDTLRFVDNRQNVTSRGLEYSACAFTVVLPEESSDGIKTCRLQIDNTDLRIMQTIKRAHGMQIIGTVSLVMSHTPDVCERGPLKFRLRNVTADKSSVTGELYDFYLSDMSFPKDTYTPDDFPGLFF